MKSSTILDCYLDWILSLDSQLPCFMFTLSETEYTLLETKAKSPRILKKSVLVFILFDSLLNFALGTSISVRSAYKIVDFPYNFFFPVEVS